MGMQIIKGRNFSKDFGSDSSALIINEPTAKTLGYTDPIGKRIYSTDIQGHVTAYPIIGVVKNFNFETLHHDVGLLALRSGKIANLASFKVNTSNIKTTVAQIKNKWKAMAGGMPFSYRFLDESFNEMYRAE
jgi:putative ABC transport system permease protein